MMEIVYNLMVVSTVKSKKVGTVEKILIIFLFVKYLVEMEENNLN